MTVRPFILGVSTSLLLMASHVMAENSASKDKLDLRYENGFALRWALPVPVGNRESGTGHRQSVAAVTPTSLDPLPMAIPTSIHSAFPTPHFRLLP